MIKSIGKFAKRIVTAGVPVAGQANQFWVRIPHREHGNDFIQKNETRAGYKKIKVGWIPEN